MGAVPILSARHDAPLATDTPLATKQRQAYERRLQAADARRCWQLLLQVAAGEISAEDALRQVDISKALTELIMIGIEMGAPWPPEVHMQREATLIEKWPEACRRAGISAIPMPDDIMREITSFVGRAS